MFGKQNMTALQLRKKTLVLESELNRLALQAECERLREATGWLSWIKDTRGTKSLHGRLCCPRWPAWRWHSACAVRPRPTASCHGH